MFQVRGLVHTALSFIAGWSAIACFLFFFGYLLERREAPADEAGISFALLLTIGEGVFSVCCLYAMWGYDAILLRLAPAEYELILFE
ncbi:hypothetical protein [Bartonella queenslandensis]|uniref:hypothetical protein n=1 Tax=Bartonella queenslandensis TaxID=481138 RepID=UPI001FD16407|nr:hypothetical protein [Bartonella queenslandensis]